MQFAQLYTPGLAQCSYVIGSGDKCVVVDPARNISPYLERAKSFGMEIVGVLETHLHADFVSGHMELADKTGAKIYAPAIADCQFPHHALKDGEEFTIENLRFKLLETPGHTPDCSVYVVTDLERGEDPVLVFTGDTLLVGDVGRPDLFPNREEELAEKLYQSLKKIMELPDYVEVYPAHGMGSLCGRALSAKLWSTVGIERRQNQSLQHKDLESFKEDLLTDMPAAPDHFARCSEINRQGPTLVKNVASTEPLKVKAFQDAIKQGKKVLDVRPYMAYAAAHIPGSYSISHHSNLPTFAGWIIPPEEELLLVLENETDLKKVLITLQNVGVDNVVGYLAGAMEDWVSSGLKVDHIETISVQELKELLQEEETPVVLDNRAKGEWSKGHIGKTTLAPTPDIRHRYKEWQTDEPVYVLCNTSNRSMTAASLLKQRGFEKVINVVGGTTAWSAAGYPLEEE